MWGLHNRPEPELLPEYWALCKDGFTGRQSGTTIGIGRNGDDLG